MKKLALLLIATGVLTGCGGGGGDAAGVVEPGVNVAPAELQISGLTTKNGIFDPAPTADGSGRVWMSYSEVEVSPLTPVAGSGVELDQTSTRLAFTDDNGASWTDSGFDITPAQPVSLAPPVDISVWQHEVSRLVYDSYDTDTGEPWKMLWHRHFATYHRTADAVLRLFEHGWISLKTSASPTGLKDATERKLFVGSGYDAANDVTIGPPEHRLDQEFPAAAELGQCAVFTEPAMLPMGDGIFVGLRCAKYDGVNNVVIPGKLVLLTCNRDYSNCDYVGDLLDDTEASLFGASYDGFSAPELFQQNNQTYLMTTPTQADGYRGCLIFKVADLNQDLITLQQNPLLERLNDASHTPVLVASVFGTAGSFNGACGYTRELTASGIIYSEFSATKPNFRLYSSKKRP